MRQIVEAILAGEPAAVAGLPVPDSYRGVVVHADEADMFADVAPGDRDPRKSLHVVSVPTPDLGPGEALIQPSETRGNSRAKPKGALGGSRDQKVYEKPAVGWVERRCAAEGPPNASADERLLGDGRRVRRRRS